MTLTNDENNMSTNGADNVNKTLMLKEALSMLRQIDDGNDRDNNIVRRRRGQQHQQQGDKMTTGSKANTDANTSAGTTKSATTSSLSTSSKIVDSAIPIRRSSQRDIRAFLGQQIHHRNRRLDADKRRKERRANKTRQLNDGTSNTARNENDYLYYPHPRYWRRLPTEEVRYDTHLTSTDPTTDTNDGNGGVIGIIFLYI